MKSRLIRTMFQADILRRNEQYRRLTMTKNREAYTVQYQLHKNDVWRTGITGISRERAMDRAAEWKRLNTAYDTRVV